MLKKINLKQKLLIMLIIFSFVPTFVLSGSLYSKLYEIRSNEMEKMLYRSISNNTDNFNDWINSKLNLIRSTKFFLSRVKDASGVEISEIVKEINAKSPNVEEVYILKDADLNLQWYNNSVTGENFKLSKVHRDKFQNDVITFSSDIIFKSEKYVLAIDITLIELKHNLDKLYYKNGIGSSLLYENEIVYLDDGIENISLEKIIFNKRSPIRLDFEDGQVIGINNDIQEGLSLLIVENFSNNLLNIVKLKMNFINWIVALFLITIMIDIFLSRRLISPIENIKKRIRSVLNRENRFSVINNNEYEYLELYSLFKDMNEVDTKLYYSEIEMLQNLEQCKIEYSRSIKEFENASELNVKIKNSIEFSDIKYNSLFNNIKDFIWTIDIDGNLNSVNDVFLEKLGYKKEEVIGKKFEDIVIQSDKVVNVNDFTFDILKNDQNDITVYLKKRLFSEYELVVFNSKRLVENGRLVGVQFVARTIIDKEILERKMYRRNKELEFIKEISRTLTNSRNLDDLLTNISEKIKNLLEMGVCSIWLLNEKGYLEQKASSDRSLDVNKSVIININEDVLGQSILSSKVVKLDSFNDQSNKNYESMRTIITDIKEMIFIPLEHSGIPSGVIAIGAGSHLSELDIDILSAFASQSSVAIEKAKLYEKLKLEYFNTIKVLATAVEAKDSYTEGHSIRVSKFAVIIGEKLNMTRIEIEELEISGILHDIGKIGVDDEILTKTGNLSEEEYMEIKKHPEVGARIISPIELSDSIVEGVLYHHITYDRKGYPAVDNIEIKSKIPFIIGVADALDAMTSNRLYSKKKTIGDAIKELIKFKGSQFSPEIVDVVSEIYESSSEKLYEISEFKTLK